MQTCLKREKAKAAEIFLCFTEEKNKRKYFYKLKI